MTLNHQATIEMQKQNMEALKQDLAQLTNQRRHTTALYKKIKGIKRKDPDFAQEVKSISREVRYLRVMNADSDRLEESVDAMVAHSRTKENLELQKEVKAFDKDTDNLINAIRNERTRLERTVRYGIFGSFVDFIMSKNKYALISRTGAVTGIVAGIAVLDWNPNTVGQKVELISVAGITVTLATEVFCDARSAINLWRTLASSQDGINRLLNELDGGKK